MKYSSSRVSREVGVSPRFTRFARAGLSGASAGVAWIARGGRRVIPAARLGLRATRRSGSMPAVPHTSGPTPRITSTPNHALQRTATAVTARASAAAFPPAMHGPRQPPPSLSLGSLGRFTRHALSSITVSPFGSRGRGRSVWVFGRFAARARSDAAQRADGFVFEFGCRWRCERGSASPVRLRRALAAASRRA